MDKESLMLIGILFIVLLVIFILFIDPIQTGIENLQSNIRGLILMKTCYYTTKTGHAFSANNDLARKTINKALSNIANKGDVQHYYKFRYVKDGKVQEYYLVPVDLNDCPWFGLSIHDYMELHRIKELNKKDPKYNPGFIHIYRSTYNGLIPSIRYFGTLAVGNDSFYASKSNDGKDMYNLITWIASDFGYTNKYPKKRFIFW